MGAMVTGRRLPLAPRPGKVPNERPGKVGGKRHENRQRRTLALCNAALALMLNRGIESVTIDDIVARAGVAKGSFYRYFDDKTQLVSALIDPLGSQVLSAIDSCASALRDAKGPDELARSYQSLAGDIIRSVFANTDLTLLYLQESRSPAAGARGPVRALADKVTDRCLELTRVGIDRGLLRAIDPTVTAVTTVGAAERLMFFALTTETPLNTLQVSQSLISLVLYGIRASSSPAD